jgi:hypothetical protein
MTKLSGQRSECTTCGLLFTSTCSFDKHRVGRYGAGRRCLTAAELTAKGWSPNQGGFWRIALVGPHFMAAAA